jgi:hypothetical protein
MFWHSIALAAAVVATTVLSIPHTPSVQCCLTFILTPLTTSLVHPQTVSVRRWLELHFVLCRTKKKSIFRRCCIPVERLLKSSCMPVCTRFATREKLNGFSRKLQRFFETFLVLVKTGDNNCSFTPRSVHLQQNKLHIYRVKNVWNTRITWHCVCVCVQRIFRNFYSSRAN